MIATEQHVGVEVVGAEEVAHSTLAHIRGSSPPGSFALGIEVVVGEVLVGASVSEDPVGDEGWRALTSEYENVVKALVFSNCQTCSAMIKNRPVANRRRRPD